MKSVYRKIRYERVFTKSDALFLLVFNIYSFLLHYCLLPLSGPYDYSTIKI